MPDPQQPSSKPALAGALLALVREHAIDVGMALAERAFRNRKGHGQAPKVSERHLSEPELGALLAFGFEHGVEAALRGEFADAHKELPEAAVNARLDAEREGETAWLAACEAQGWSAAKRAQLLHRFMRDRGLMAELGEAARQWSAVDNASIEAQDSGAGQSHPRG